MKQGIYYLAILCFLTSCGEGATENATTEASGESTAKVEEQDAPGLPSLIGTWLMYEGTEATGEPETIIFHSDKTVETVSASGRVEKASFEFDPSTGELVTIEQRGSNTKRTTIKVHFANADLAHLQGSIPGEARKGETETQDVEFNLVLKKKQ